MKKKFDACFSLRSVLVCSSLVHGMAKEVQKSVKLKQSVQKQMWQERTKTTPNTEPMRETNDSEAGQLAFLL
jgi:hypothetical protein